MSKWPKSIGGRVLRTAYDEKIANLQLFHRISYEKLRKTIEAVV